MKTKKINKKWEDKKVIMLAIKSKRQKLESNEKEYDELKKNEVIYHSTSDNMIIDSDIVFLKDQETGNIFQIYKLIEIIPNGGSNDIPGERISKSLYNLKLQLIKRIKINTEKCWKRYKFKAGSQHGIIQEKK